MRAARMSCHFFRMVLKSARESMKPMQIRERGVVALPIKVVASVIKVGRVRLVRKRSMPRRMARMLGFRKMFLKSFGVILCSKSQTPLEKRAILKALEN